MQEAGGIWQLLLSKLRLPAIAIQDGGRKTVFAGKSSQPMDLEARACWRAQTSAIWKVQEWGWTSLSWFSLTTFGCAVAAILEIRVYSQYAQCIGGVSQWISETIQHTVFKWVPIKSHWTEEEQVSYAFRVCLPVLCWRPFWIVTYVTLPSKVGTMSHAVVQRNHHKCDTRSIFSKFRIFMKNKSPAHGLSILVTDVDYKQ